MLSALDLKMLTLNTERLRVSKSARVLIIFLQYILCLMALTFRLSMYFNYKWYWSYSRVHLVPQGLQGNLAPPGPNGPLGGLLPGPPGRPWQGWQRWATWTSCEYVLSSVKSAAEERLSLHFITIHITSAFTVGPVISYYIWCLMHLDNLKWSHVKWITLIKIVT